MSSITELKSILSGLQASITDEGVQSFEKAIDEIRSSYENTPTVITLLKMLRALCKYLDAKKTGIHGDTFPLIDAISDKLETMMDDPDLDENTVNEMMSDQIAEYRIFQQKIISNPAVSEEDMDKLREVLLAIDWEITDETLSDFDTVLTDLIDKFKGYRIHYVFLKIIHTTGTFIGDQKASAPSNSISFLRSVFEHFQEMVNTDNISLDEKKEVLAKDIERFQEYKASCYSSEKPSEQEGMPEAELEFDFEPDVETEEESVTEAEIEFEDEELESDITPALSDYGSGDESEDLEFIPLEEMPDEDDSLSSLVEDDTVDTDSSQLVSDDAEDDAQKDVMDDLFSVKETPADELLDAIHLMEVHGEKGEDQAMRMLDQSSGPQVGAKSLTAEKKDDAPIPEIDSRLDQFFSLDAPTLKEDGEVNELEAELDEIDIEPDAEKDEPVPEPEEEAPEAPAFQDDFEEEEDFEPDLSDTTVLNRLKLNLETKEYMDDTSILLSAGEDIQTLRELWKEDPQKLNLLDIISKFIDLPDTESPVDADKMESEESSDTVTPEETDDTDTQADGMWGKIKSMFSR